MTTTTTTNELDRIFNDLKNSDDAEVRLRLAQDVRSYLSSAAMGDIKSDAELKKLNDDVNSRLLELIHSQKTNQVLAGLEVINQLLDLEERTSKNIFKYWNYVKTLFPHPTVEVMLAASTTLGKIAKVRGTLLGERFMDKEVPSAIEMMQSSDHQRQHPSSPSPFISTSETRHAGILILLQLARNSPAYFYPHAPAVLDEHLSKCLLRDRREMVREAAGALFAACLDVLGMKEHRKEEGDDSYHGTSSSSSSLSHYVSKVMMVLRDVEAGLKRVPQPAVEVVHGSLVVYREMFLHAGMFMKDAFLDVAEQILRFRSYRDPLVRVTVVKTIPVLAEYDTATFTKHLLRSSMVVLLDHLEKPSERDAAFISIGQIALHIGSDMKPYLQSIVDHITAALVLLSKSQRNVVQPNESSVFQCIGMLATAMGPNMTKPLQAQLPFIFACELSEAMTHALADVTRHVPVLVKDIQGRLLNLISQTLSQRPYVRLGAPKVGRMDEDGGGVVPQEKSPRTIILALTTLGTFDFSGHVLSELARRCALPYVDSEDTETRRAAAITCSRVFADDPSTYQSSGHSLEVISDVLDKLVRMAVADPEPSVRRAVLGSLRPSFDRHLSQAENVRSLVLTLNDGVFENQVCAVGLLGRLARHNPAYVAPSLRKMLIQLLTELEYSLVQRKREEASGLLALIINANANSNNNTTNNNLIRPYALPMLELFLAKADDDRNPRVAVNILMCLGELAVVIGEDAAPYLPVLMRIVVERLADPVVAKRNAAIRALGQICSGTGYVVDPLVEYPQMLQMFERILGGKGREEAEGSVRREAIRVLGIVGAVDPYRRRQSGRGVASESMNVVRGGSTAQLQLEMLSNTSREDYFHDLVFGALLRILRDPLLGDYKTSAIEAVMSIFKIEGMRSIGVLPQIIPVFISIMRSSPTRSDFYLEQLTILVGIVKLHIRNFIPDLVGLFVELWDKSTGRAPIISCVNAIAGVLGAEFSRCLPSIVPLFIKDVTNDAGGGAQVNVQMRILDFFLTLKDKVEDYLYLVLPVILNACENKKGELNRNITVQLQKKGLQTLAGLTRHVNLTDHASPIVHCLLRVLGQGDEEVRGVALDAMCVLMVQMGPEFLCFVPTVDKTLSRHSISSLQYRAIAEEIVNGERPSAPTDIPSAVPQRLDFSAPALSRRLTVNQEHLRVAWDTSRISSADDWDQWIHCLEIELIKESPSHPVRACMTLGNTYPALTRELFNAAFYSCWGHISEDLHEELLHVIEMALVSSIAPLELVHRLLNLAEFMERQGQPLPINIESFGNYALGCGAYAKAMHYKELQFSIDPSPALIESLISLNTRLEQHDAALGMFALARDRYDIAKHEEWYERLGHWDDALAGYENKLAIDPQHMETRLGRLRCLHALGEWDALAVSCSDLWSTSGPDLRKRIAPLATAASWALRAWDSMDDYLTLIPSDSPDLSFYLAVLAVHRNQFTKALEHIANARDLLFPDLMYIVGENYTRAYNALVRAQTLSELEEIIFLKQTAGQSSRWPLLQKTWTKRLQGCRPDVDVWQRILQVRMLVVNPENDSLIWTKFANLCRKSNQMALAEKTLNSLRSPAHGFSKAPPHVIYSHLKLSWAKGSRIESLDFLRQFASSLLQEVKHRSTQGPHDEYSSSKMTDLTKLLARCYCKLGTWQIELKDSWDSRNVDDILHSYQIAANWDPSWSKAWHKWALANFDILAYMESKRGSGVDFQNTLVLHVVQAVDGFFRAISLRSEGNLQDTLRILTLWFKYGSDVDVCQAISLGVPTVGVDTWLDVVPQLIARIHTSRSQLQSYIHTLLEDVGKHHPQAVIYALIVASESSSTPRRNAAQNIIGRIRGHSPNIVNQALMVGSELLRVAILWPELWHGALEEASRRYYIDNNPEAMIATLEPLYDLMKSPTTHAETTFVQTNGQDLLQAREHCQRWRSRGNTTEMDKAWDIYGTVFRRLEKHLETKTSVDLQQASPLLHEAQHLDLAVPGTYRSGYPVITIDSFVDRLTVLHTKQRPRQQLIRGSDGQRYQFLLKGHEDLRQDERAMQLFGLVNHILSADTDSFKRQLNIQRYPVTPLAPNAGLMGWVEGTDTLHVLIRDYRQPRNVLMNLEYRLMLQFAPDYELLPLMNKVEAFEHAQAHTSGDDLYKMFWLRSSSSEHWFERRTNYTRSMAVNSIAGHILGLGDRHPSNLLVKKDSGKVVHIDFGDCFEVAMHRETYPEKVPFRLTRMLVHAMEVSRIEGSFRRTCEITTRVLRDNKESLMAVLEAFVYDPLVTWRLMKTEMDGGANQPNSKFKANRNVPQVQPQPQNHSRKLKTEEKDVFDEQAGVLEVRNEHAVAAYNRVQHKLSGREFQPSEVLSVEQQVECLIQQATSVENLCQAFPGWCAYW